MIQNDNMSDIKTKLLERRDFNLKFDDAPMAGGLTGELSPGWAEPTYDAFFTRMVDSPVLLNQSHVFPMTSLMHDLDMLYSDVELETQRDGSTGISKGLTDVETVPDMSRKQLLAIPLQAKTIITDNFLDENIEKENFMNTYTNLLAEAMGPAFERFGLFADKQVTTQPGEGTGYKMADGILTQLKQISESGTTDAKGIADLVYNGNELEGIIESIMAYIDQDGDIANATCVLPPQVYARVMAQIAIGRETAYGDMVFQNGDVTKIMGVPLVQDNILRDTRNQYDKMKFTDGAYASGGTEVDKMTYGFIGKPDNIIFGLMRDFESKNQWDIDILGYKVALLCKGDVKVLWDQDTLAIPFTRNNKE